jgi:plasmid stabilization system protein ParE
MAHDISSTDRVQQRLRSLIRDYAQTRSPATADAVVRLIESLSDHPAFSGRGAERCAYLRLKTHWRCLALATAPAD